MYYIYCYDGHWVGDADAKAREFSTLAEAREFVQKMFDPNNWDDYLIVYAVEFYHITAAAKTKKVGNPL